MYLCWGQDEKLSETEHQFEPWQEESLDGGRRPISFFCLPQAVGNTEVKGQGKKYNVFTLNCIVGNTSNKKLKVEQVL